MIEPAPAGPTPLPPSSRSSAIDREPAAALPPRGWGRGGCGRGSGSEGTGSKPLTHSPRTGGTGPAFLAADRRQKVCSQVAIITVLVERPDPGVPHY